MKLKIDIDKIHYFINHSLASSMVDKAFAFTPVNFFTKFKNIFFTPVIPRTAVFFKRNFNFLPDSLKALIAFLFVYAPVVSTISKAYFFPDWILRFMIFYIKDGN